MKNIAVIIYNLGGPSNLSEVKGFLFNLFYDKNIIRVHNPIRYLIAKIISGKRAPIAQDIYSKMGGKSPILELTNDQSSSLKNILEEKDKENNYKIFVAMRYSYPFSKNVIEQIKNDNFDEILLVPLYPQFSTTTTYSSIEDIMKEIKRYDLKIPVKSLCCYFDDDDFIDGHIELLKEKLPSDYKDYRVLFSAHGLPEKVVKDGDPYQWQVDKTVEKIIEKLGIKDLDYITCYQSRVGPMKWIGPSTDNEIKRAGEDKKNIILVPIAFVSEHSETLVEQDIEYKHLSTTYGVDKYLRVKALGINKNFIESLAKICLYLKNIDNDSQYQILSLKKKRLCPKEFCGCINNN